MIDGRSSLARRLAQLVPAPTRTRIKGAWGHVEAAYARRRWEEATPTGPLHTGALEQLAQRYPVGAPAYDYTPDAVFARGRERFEILAPHAAPRAAVLEVGAADGMTACAMARQGRAATAIDIDTSRTDSRVRAAGVQVIEMDATRLDFPDASFDLVYSFNVFEHLSDPAATFAEMTRVLRPGGVAFVSFMGLRWSPHGGHLYRAIGIPYVTVLFEASDVARFLAARGVSERAPWVNECSVEQFRAAFRAQAPAYARFAYTETYNRWHARLIAQYPGAFRAAPSFNSLLADSIRVCGCKAA